MFDAISPASTRKTLVDSLRVRWVLCSPTTLCTPYFQRLRAFAISPHPGVDGFPVLRLLRPIRHFLRHRGFVGGSLPYFPLPFASFRKLPVFVMEDSNGMSKVACYWLPRPLFAASQSTYRVGQVDLYRHGNETPCSGPYSGLASTISGLTGWHLRQGMPGPRFTVGLCTLQVIHHVIPQPSTTSWRLVSSSWCLSGACCSRHRVVYNAEPQGLIGCLYTQGVSTFFHAAFTAHSEARAEAVGVGSSAWLGADSGRGQKVMRVWPQFLLSRQFPLSTVGILPFFFSEVPPV